MKTYALRVEKAESVIGHLAVQKPQRLITAAYEVFVSSLVASLGKHAAEPVKIETHQYERLEQAKARYLRSGPYICLDSQSSLGLPRGG